MLLYDSNQGGIKNALVHLIVYIGIFGIIAFPLLSILGFYYEWMQKLPYSYSIIKNFIYKFNINIDYQEDLWQKIYWILIPILMLIHELTHLYYLERYGGKCKRGIRYYFIISIEVTGYPYTIREYLTCLLLPIISTSVLPLVFLFSTNNNFIIALFCAIIVASASDIAQSLLISILKIFYKARTVQMYQDGKIEGFRVYS